MIQNAADNEPIILIGPMKAGKTTVGRLLAAWLHRSFSSLDRVERHYTEAFGFDTHLADTIQHTQGTGLGIVTGANSLPRRSCSFLQSMLPVCSNWVADIPSSPTRYTKHVWTMPSHPSSMWCYYCPHLTLRRRCASEDAA